MKPSDRLARSRLAIIEHLEQRDHKREARNAQDDESEPEPGDGEASGRQSAAGWLGGMSGAARSWWRHHPAQLAVEMLKPSLQSYARRKPFTVLGVSALVGAGLVFARPWRLISLTTLLIAVVKSSQLSGALMSALSDAQDWQAPPRRPGQG